MRTLIPLLIACSALSACRDAARDSTPPPTPDASATAKPPPTVPPEPPAPVKPAQPPLPPPGTKETGETAPEVFEGTAGAVEKKIPEVHTVELRSVRAAKHPGFDRVVFEFSGNALPGYRTEYIDKPVRRCGTGDAVEMAGQGWLKIRMTPARAHDDAGRATVGPSEQRPGLPVLLQLSPTCDFEGELSFVLGVASPNRYRVLELRDPPRIVVDVRQ